MSRAIQLAWRGRYTCHPNPRVGCVIARGDRILGEGWHVYTGGAHAEVNAMASAGHVKGSRVYLTLEPCSHQGRTPPCVNALIEAGIAEAMIAMSDPNPRVAGNGIKSLDEAGISTRVGLLEAEARKLNPGFCKRMERGLPYTRCKMAMSVDGRTALANGQSRWISSDISRRNVHYLRAESGAILTSVETVIADDPSLTVRDLDIECRQPLRVVLDRQMKMPIDARLLKLDGKTVIYTASEKQTGLTSEKADVVCLADDGAWLQDVFSHLAKNYEINEVLVEAGSNLLDALLDVGLVDEFIVYVAPKVLGSDASPLVNLTGITEMDAAMKLTLIDVRQLGGDVRLTYKPEKRN